MKLLRCVCNELSIQKSFNMIERWSYQYQTFLLTNYACVQAWVTKHYFQKNMKFERRSSFKKAAALKSHSRTERFFSLYPILLMTDKNCINIHYWDKKVFFIRLSLISVSLISEFFCNVGNQRQPPAPSARPQTAAENPTILSARYIDTVGWGLDVGQVRGRSEASKRESRTTRYHMLVGHVYENLENAFVTAILGWPGTEKLGVSCTRMSREICYESAEYTAYSKFEIGNQANQDILYEIRLISYDYTTILWRFPLYLRQNCWQPRSPEKFTNKVLLRDKRPYKETRVCNYRNVSVFSSFIVSISSAFWISK